MLKHDNSHYERHSSCSVITIFLKFSRAFCHSLKMCMWFLYKPVGNIKVNNWIKYVQVTSSPFSTESTMEYSPASTIKADEMNDPVSTLSHHFQSCIYWPAGYYSLLLVNSRNIGSWAVCYTSTRGNICLQLPLQFYTDFLQTLHCLAGFVRFTDNFATFLRRKPSHFSGLHCIDVYI